MEIFGEPGTITVTWLISDPPGAPPGTGWGDFPFWLQVAGPTSSLAFSNTGAWILYDANGLPTTYADNATYTFDAGFDTVFWNPPISQCGSYGCAGFVSPQVTVALDPLPLPSSLLLFASVLTAALILLMRHKIRPRPTAAG